MSTNKMRATFSQRGDGLFMLECLALLVENLGAKVGQTPDAVVRDLYSIVTNKVKP